MKTFLSAALVAALLPALAGAAVDPADPDAPAPRPQYRSVFQDTPAGVEEGSEDWQRANVEVGQFRRGHIDLLKWETAQPTPPAPAPSGSPAQPQAEVPTQTPTHRHMHKPGGASR